MSIVSLGRLRNLRVLRCGACRNWRLEISLFLIVINRSLCINSGVDSSCEDVLLIVIDRRLGKY